MTDERETVIELVDRLVRRAGFDTLVESNTNLIIYTLVAIALVIAILNKLGWL